jgi:hypothetical protein
VDQRPLGPEGWAAAQSSRLHLAFRVGATVAETLVNLAARLAFREDVTMNLRIYTYTLPSLKPALPEICEGRCPYCKGDAVVPAGYVMGIAGMIKMEYRCTVCETAFLVVREAII